MPEPKLPPLKLHLYSQPTAESQSWYVLTFVLNRETRDGGVLGTLDRNPRAGRTLDPPFADSEWAPRKKLLRENLATTYKKSTGTPGYPKRPHANSVLGQRRQSKVRPLHYFCGLGETVKAAAYRHRPYEMEKRFRLHDEPAQGRPILEPGDYPRCALLLGNS